MCLAVVVTLSSDAPSEHYIIVCHYHMECMFCRPCEGYTVSGQFLV